MSSMEKLGQKLLPIYAAALGKAPDFFNDKFDRADISSRFGHYPPGDGNDPNEFGAAPHADAGFLTLLPQAAVPGLEIATQSGKWKIGRAHVRTPVTNAHLVCRLLLETHNHTQIKYLTAPNDNNTK